MTIRKISDHPFPCRHLEHAPPLMIVLEPETYEYTCPGCGGKTVFVIASQGPTTSWQNESKRGWRESWPWMREKMTIVKASPPVGAAGCATILPGNPGSSHSVRLAAFLP